MVVINHRLAPSIDADTLTAMDGGNVEGLRERCRPCAWSVSVYSVWSLSHTSRRALSWAVGGLLASALLAGCGTEAIIVSEAAIADRPDALVVGWMAQDTPRQVFSPEDDEVTLHARFEFNYRAVYEWYRVDWIAPDGSPYKVVSLRTDFGSHRDIKASLKIRGKMASRMPGLWRVRLWLQGRKGAPDRLLVSRLFRIAEPTPAMLAAGLTSVDEPAASTERPLARRAPAPLEPETLIAAAGVSPMDVTANAPSPPTSQPKPSPAAPRRDEGAVLLPPLAVLAPPAWPAGNSAGAAALRREPGRTESPGTAGGMGKLDKRAPPPAPAMEPGEPRPSPAAAGLASVTLTAKPAAPGTPLRRSFRRDFPGCPPLYYSPGPGCVEQAPEE